jgi:hypothetical protein
LKKKIAEKNKNGAETVSHTVFSTLVPRLLLRKSSVETSKE